MARSRKDKPKAPSHLELTEAFVEQFIESEIESDLERVGIVWSGILGTDKPISPSTVAALLSAYDLVLATALIESENHWARAAAYAVLGNKTEPRDIEETHENEGRIEKASSDFKIGFGPSSKQENEDA